MENPKEADDNVSRKKFSVKNFKGTLKQTVVKCSALIKKLFGEGACNFYVSV